MLRQKGTCPLRNVPMSPSNINIEYSSSFYGDRGVSPGCPLFLAGTYYGDRGTGRGQGGVPVDKQIPKPFCGIWGHGDIYLYGGCPRIRGEK